MATKRKCHMLSTWWGSYISFFVLSTHTVSFQYSILPVQKKFTESIDPVTLPIFHQSSEFFYSLQTVFTVDSCVCPLEYSLGSCDTLRNILFALVIKITPIT